MEAFALLPAGMEVAAKVVGAVAALPQVMDIF
jgi:hypothetical protein